MMSEYQRKILEMIDQGTITPEDGERLLKALEEGQPAEAAPEQPKSIYTASMEMARKAVETAKEEMEKIHFGDVGEQLEEAGKQLEEAREQLENFPFSEEEMKNFPFGVSEEEMKNFPFGEGGPGEGDTRASSREYPPMAGELESLYIKWVKGDIEILLTDGDAIKVTEYSSAFDLKKDNTQVELEGGELRISWDKNSWRKQEERPNTKTRHLQLELPRDSLSSLEDVEIKSVSGMITLPDLSVEDLTVSVVNGSVNASRLQAEDLAVSTVNGEVNASHLQAEDMKVSCVSGALQIQNIQGENVEVSSMNGGIYVQNFRGEDVRLETVDGELKAVGTGESLEVSTVSGPAEVILTEMPDSDVNLHTVSGRVSLKIPESGGFTVDYNTKFGSFRSDFPLEGTIGAKIGEGTYGSGDTEISASAIDGAIELLRMNS